MTAATVSGDRRESDPSLVWRHDRAQLLLYGAVVLLGSVLIVVTAHNQPYNQNEWQQIGPYDDPSLAVAVSGTRQPPLDALLGALLQRLTGEGHLEQRLVPMISGVLTLLLMVVVLRGLRTGYGGVVALAFMATAPVFLRFSAYTRPYALPLMLMVLCAVAGTRWLETGRRRWLVAAVGSSFALPLTRVPEPTVFLAASAVVLVLAGWARRLPRGRAWLLTLGLVAPLVTVGVFSALTLARETADTSTGDALLDLDIGRALGRTPEGARELWEHVVPLYGHWFPWWPVVALVCVLGLALPATRRRLLATWYWLPLVLAPLAFLVAYHTVNAFPLEMRHYQIRFACFWVPPLVVLVAVVLQALGAARHRWLAPLLAAALVVGQLPGTWRVLTENDAVDFAQAGAVVRDRIPAGAVVIYDSAAQAGWWRQPFSGRDRYLPEDVRVVSAERIASGRVRLPADAPVYVLLLDSDCASATACDIPGLSWDGRVDGYERIERFDRFTLYAPAEEQRGLSGASRALQSLVDAFGPRWAVTDAAAAARLLRQQGSVDAAADLVTGVCEAHGATGSEACEKEVKGYGLAPLLRPR